MFAGRDQAVNYSVEVEDEEDDELEPVVEEEFELSLLALDSVLLVSDLVSFEDEAESLLDAPARPLADPDEDRESVMYQPLPLKTMPTGWITLRKAPPHCSHVVSGGSEKLWRFSMTSSQAVHL